MSKSAFKMLQRVLYPLLCVLCLALLPYQPDNDPLNAAAQIAQGLLGSR